VAKLFCAVAWYIISEVRYVFRVHARKLSRDCKGAVCPRIRYSNREIGYLAQHHMPAYHA